MKKTVIILVICLGVFLSGCNKAETKNTTNQDLLNDSNLYYNTYRVGLSEYFDNVISIDHIDGTVYVSGYMSNNFEEEFKIISFDSDFNAEPVLSYNSDACYYGPIFMSADNMWIIKTGVPEIVGSTSMASSYLLKVNYTGEVVYDTIIQNGDDIFEASSILSISVNEKGSLYIATNKLILEYAEDGTLLDIIQTTYGISGVITSGGGDTYALTYDDTGKYSLSGIRDSGLLEGKAIDGFNSAIFYEGNVHDFYVNDSSYLYSIDIESGISNELFSWINCNVNSDYIVCVDILSSEIINVIEYDSSKSEFVLVTIHRVSEDEEFDKIIISYGTYSLNTFMKNAILSFNNSNDKYRVEVIEYKDGSMYNELDLALVSGNCPDIIDMTGLSVSKYVNKNVLVNLYQLMVDSEISPSSIVAGYRNAMEIDGGLYTLSPSFRFTTAVSNIKYGNENMSWTLSEFANVVEMMPDGSNIVDELTCYEFFYFMLRCTFDNYIDWATGTCDFDKDDFINLLSISNDLPQEIVYIYEEDNISRLNDGSLIMSFYTLNILKGYRSDLEQRGPNICYVGIPGVSGSGAVLRVDDEFALYSGSEHIDEAWNFVKFIISEEYNESVRFGLPILQSTLEKKIQEVTQITEGMALSQENAEELLYIINNADTIIRDDDVILTLIAEEAATYFDGFKTIAEVCDIITAKVNTYLSEIY